MFGALPKPDKNGIRRVRGCKDPTARGRRSRRSRLSAQRRAAKNAAVAAVGPLRPGNEEHYAGRLLVEFKSGAQIGPLVRAFEKGEKQAESQRSTGDNRPFVYGAIPQPEGKDVIYAFRSRSEDETRDLVYEWAVQLNLLDP